MRTFKFSGGFRDYRAEPIADGEYHIRPIGGHKLPGLVIGGRRTWAIQLAGHQWRETYPSARAACRALVRHHERAAIDAESSRHEWLPADDNWTPRGPAVPRPFAGA